MSKTLASVLLPGPAGLFVGEAVDKGLDMLSGKIDADEARLFRQIEGIALSITSSALDQHEFSRIPPNDIEAAILAVSDTILTVPISAALIRESGYSAIGLAEYYRRNAQDILKRAMLGEAEYAYVRILESVSHQIVSVLRVSPEAHFLALADLTAQLHTVQQRLNNPRRLYSELQHGALDEYLLTYRLEAGKQLARDRRSTSGGIVRWLPTDVAYVEQGVAGLDDLGGLEELLKQQRRILLEADPGQGKTVLLRQTFLRSLAYHGSSAESWIPIYIDLRGLQEFPGLDASVSRAYKWLPKGPEGWVDRLVREGKAMVLLDNVDDLLSDAPARMKNEIDIDGFMADVVGESAVLIAARRGTFSSEWAHRNGFATLDLVPYETDRVFEQIRRWHDAIASECATVEEQEHVSVRGMELRMALCQVSDLMGLGRNPLVCALMCEAFLDSSVSLPRDWIVLVDDVLDRLAIWDSRPYDPILNAAARVRDIQRDLAGWAIHNEAPFDASHLADAIGQFVPDWGVEQDPEVVVDRILSRTSLLRRNLQGLAFISDEMRDHLAAGDLISFGNVNYLRAEARNLTKPRLVIAAAGRARQERATELVTALLDDAAQDLEVSDPLVVIAFCCASATRSLEGGVRDRVRDAVADLVSRGDAARLGDSRVASLALDMLVRIMQDEGSTAAVVAMAVEIAARTGASALPVLQAIARDADQDSQEVLWQSWSRFDVRSFARTVLSACTSVPDVLVIDSQEKFAAVADLPGVRVIEVVCQVDASEIRGRGGLMVRAADIGMVASADNLGPDSRIVLVGEEGDSIGSGDRLS